MASNAFIVVKDTEFPKMGNPSVGTEFEVNDHRGVIVGIATVASSGLFGVPTLYTTYRRALQYIPNPRFTISYVLVSPKSPADIPQIERQVQALGYLALTKDEFMDKISKFYMFQTGLGMNLLIMTVMSFIVGLSISGQTFYTFILENLEKFGALKAIGAKSRELDLPMISSSRPASRRLRVLGWVSVCAPLVIWLAKLRLPDYAAMITWWNPRTCFGNGHDHRRGFKLCRGSQSIADRTVRYLSEGNDMTAEAASKATGQIVQVVRRRRSQNDRGERRQPRDVVRRDGLYRGSVG